MKLRVQRRDLPVAPAAATAAVVLAGLLTFAGVFPAVIMVAVGALLCALLWRDRHMRVELVAQVVVLRQVNPRWARKSSELLPQVVDRIRTILDKGAGRFTRGSADLMLHLDRLQLNELFR